MGGLASHALVKRVRIFYATGAFAPKIDAALGEEKPAPPTYKFTYRSQKMEYCTVRGNLISLRYRHQIRDCMA